MIVTVASFKGGVGKTTTAIHLAAFLQGYAGTLLIDADPNQSALTWASRGELPFVVVDQWQAREVSSSHGHVVIDTPARPVADDLALLATTCDLLVLPTTPDSLALDALALMVQHLAGLPIAPYCVLLTMIPPYPSRAGAEVREMLSTTSVPLLEGGIRRYAAFQKAALAGTAVYDVKDTKAEAGWQDYVAIGREVLTYAPEAKDKKL
ncbi:MAG: ParA family protein [Nodosilinea sp.]